MIYDLGFRIYGLFINHKSYFINLLSVDLGGVEPPASSLQMKRSTR